MVVGGEWCVGLWPYISRVCVGFVCYRVASLLGIGVDLGPGSLRIWDLGWSGNVYEVGRGGWG